jgi:hypothetical protein
MNMVRSATNMPCVGSDGIPSIEPYTPSLIHPLVRLRRQRATLLLERPEEQGAVGIAGTIYGDVPRPVAAEVEGRVGKWLRYLKVWYARVRSQVRTQVLGNTRTLLPLGPVFTGGYPRISVGEGILAECTRKADSSENGS